MGKFFTAYDHICFLVSELDFDPLQAEKLVQNPSSELYEEKLRRVYATNKFFSRCFGEINLSDQGEYTAQHMQWFEKAENVDEVTYLKGKKCFFCNDVMVLSDKNDNNINVISTQSFLNCLVDDRGLRHRIENLFNDKNDKKIYKMLDDFLSWHFEKVNWKKYRDNV